MIVSVVPIGDSKGVRIHKNILDELKIENKLEMYIYNDEIVLKKPEKIPRKGWEAAFMEMHNLGDDKLIISEQSENNSFEWEWE